MADTSEKIKEAFKSTVTKRLAQHPNEWPSDASHTVLRAILDQVVDDGGKPIRLKREEEDIIEVTTRPTLDVQTRVIRHVLESHNAQMSRDLESMIRRVVNPTAFRQELVKAGFIKDKNAAGLKDLLG